MVILRKISSKDTMKDARKQYRLIFPLYINILTHKLHLHNINIYILFTYSHIDFYVVSAATYLNDLSAAGSQPTLHYLK
jgi:hypothetical protein